MTREHAKKMLPFITAYAEGKPVQYRFPESNDIWLNGENLGFENPRCEYRIKPEPRVRYALDISEYGLLSQFFVLREDALDFKNRAYPNREASIVKLVEEVPE